MNPQNGLITANEEAGARMFPSSPSSLPLNIHKCLRLLAFAKPRPEFRTHHPSSMGSEVLMERLTVNSGSQGDSAVRHTGESPGCSEWLSPWEGPLDWASHSVLLRAYSETFRKGFWVEHSGLWC